MAIEDDELSPSERIRLNAVKQQQENTIQATKNLEASIKQLAADNRRDGDPEKIQYTYNVLAIREYSAQLSKSMTDETSKLFDQLEELNSESRKQTKSEQRDNLKQLDILRALSQNVGDEDQRLQLQNFIDQSESAIKENTSKFSSFISKAIENTDSLTSIVAALNDSPLLAIGATFFGGKIKDALKERQDKKYAIQEGEENQLAERYAEIQNLQKEEEKILREIEKRNKEDDSTTPEIVPPDSSSELDDFSGMDVSALTDLLEEIDYDIITLTEEFIKYADKNVNMENTSPTVVDFNNDIMEEGVYELISINEKLSPLLNNMEENKRESDRFNSKMLSVLEQIAGNGSGNTSPLKESENDSIMGTLAILKGGMIASTMAFVGTFITGFKTALTVVAKGLIKVVSKLFLPALIIGTLFSGVMEAVDVFNETGSLKDAAIGFFGGMLDFLTLGFFGTEQLTNLIDTITEYTEPLVDIFLAPIKLFYNTVSSLFNGDAITGAIDSIKNFDFIGTIVDGFFSITDSLLDVIQDLTDMDLGKLLKDKLNELLGDSWLGQQVKELLGESNPTVKKVEPLAIDGATLGEAINNSSSKVDESFVPAKEQNNSQGKILNEMHMINGVPVSKAEFEAASKSMTMERTTGADAAFNQINTSQVNNNNTQVIAPRARADNDDFMFREMSHNSY